MSTSEEKEKDLSHLGAYADPFQDKSKEQAQIEEQEEKLLDSMTEQLNSMSSSCKNKLLAKLGATSQEPMFSHSHHEFSQGHHSEEEYDTHPDEPKYLHTEIPRLPVFSGSKPGKGEVTYRQWRYGVTSLYVDKTWPQSAILEAVRRSLRGMAADTLISLGMNITVKEVVVKLDSIFGTVDTPEQLIEKFYIARQEDKESVSEWGCRLTGLASKARQAGVITPLGLEDMMRCKFFSGLTSHDIKNSIRHRFDAGASYDVLLRAARQIEEELLQESRVARKKTVQTSQQQATKQSAPASNQGPNLSKIEKQLAELVSSVKSLESRVVSVETSTRPVVPAPRSGRHCYQCGNPNHLRSECPILGRGRQANTNGNYQQGSQNTQLKQQGRTQQQKPLNW